MVACLERTDGNIELHQIVDFLTNSPIHYALTQIHATVDDKTAVISESSVRINLHFNDEDGITCLSNVEIFVNLALMGSSGPPKKVGDEAIYTREVDKVVRSATTATSLEAEQESGNIHKTRSMATLNEPSLQGTGLGSGPRCQDSTLGDVDAQTRVLALETSKTAQDLVIKKLKKKVKRLEKKQRARTIGMKLFKIEGDFDDDFEDIDDMVNEEIENVEGDIVNAGGLVNSATTRVSTASTSVTTAGISISTTEPRTPPTTTTTAFKDEDLTIAQTLLEMRSEKAKEKGVAFRDVEESARSTKILPTMNLKDNGKGIMKEPKKPPKNPRKGSDSDG
ncbi:hypothetical protein Tco_0046374 [Tanacetum coccineum]